MFPLLAVLVAILSGCATADSKPPPKISPDYFAASNNDDIANINKVALISGSVSPTIEAVDLGLIRSESAAEGAAAGAKAGAMAWSGGNCDDPYCAAALLLMLPVMIAGGAAVGSITGSIDGHSVDTLAEAEAAAQEFLSGPRIQQVLLINAENYARTNLGAGIKVVSGEKIQEPVVEEATATISDKSIDHVLKLDLISIALTEELQMRGSARLMSTLSGDVISEETYVYRSERRDLEGWMENGADSLKAAIDDGLRHLAQEAINRHFLLYYPSASTEGALARPVEDTYTLSSAIAWIPHYSLAPVYPPVELKLGLQDRSVALLSFAVVGQQPTFEWESFPRKFDGDLATTGNSRIANVRYEVRIFDAVKDENSERRAMIPNNQVYEANDIGEPFYTIGQALESCAQYFWTVRARFRLDGKERFTHWAASDAYLIGSGEVNRGRLTRPERDYFYPFQTACN